MTLCVCTPDSVSSQLHCKGIGTECKSASVITYEDESVPWERDLLGSGMPRVLQYTMFAMLGST